MKVPDMYKVNGYTFRGSNSFFVFVSLFSGGIISVFMIYEFELPILVI